MNPSDKDHWKSHVLDEIFRALATSEQIDKILIFKGARVLNLRIQDQGRQSLDLDSNLAAEFVENYPDRDEQQTFLQREIERAVRRHFERQELVIYELNRLTIRAHPPRGHPRGWNAFVVRMNIADLGKRVHGLPVIEIDIAAPEELLPSSVGRIRVGNGSVLAYTLERIAGEKMRAFLSSLPAYREKVQKPGEAVRAKDLYDLARIHRIHGLASGEFWRQAGEEFQRACRSRYIDCCGLSTFQEQWEVTRKTYEQTVTIPKDIEFLEIENLLPSIISFWEIQRIIPFQFPLSDESTETEK